MPGNGLLDCCVGRTNRDALMLEGRAIAASRLSALGWISFGSTTVTMFRGRSTDPPRVWLPGCQVEVESFRDYC